LTDLRRITKLDYHPMFVFRECLFNIGLFLATWGLFLRSATR